MENPWFPKDSRTSITNYHQLSTGIPRLRSQEKVEAAQLELERHRKELQRKKEEVQLWGDSGDRSETSGAADSEWLFHGIYSTAFSLVLACFGCVACQSSVFNIQLVLRSG